MNQREVLDRLRNAKSAHLGWVNRAHSLIEGKPVDKEKIPVMSTDCIFGSWYYGEGQALKRLPSYGDIEPPHNELHKVYAEIFNLLFEQGKGGFFSRLSGCYKREKQQRLEEAKQKFHKLQQMSNLIVSRLDKLEKDIRELSEEQQNALFGG